MTAEQRRAERYDPRDADPLRGYIRIRTPDDEPGSWTAQGDLRPGTPYTYVSGNVAVLVDWGRRFDEAELLADPDFRDRETREELRSGFVIVWLLMAIVAGFAIAWLWWTFR